MIFSLLLAFSSTARADMVACMLQAGGGSPTAGAVGVPTNVVPAVVVDSYCSGLETDVSASLTTAEGESVHEESWTASSEAPLHHLKGLGLLAPEAAYVLHVASADSLINYEVEFTTGVDEAAELEGAPSLSFVDSPFWSGGETSSQVSVTPAADPDGLGFVGVAFAETPDSAAEAWAAGGVEEVHPDRLDETAPDEVCLIPVQWDAAGRRTEGEEVCHTVTTALCSTGSGASASAAAAALALVALARRRR